MGGTPCPLVLVSACARVFVFVPLRLCIYVCVCAFVCMCARALVFVCMYTLPVCGAGWHRRRIRCRICPTTISSFPETRTMLWVSTASARFLEPFQHHHPTHHTHTRKPTHACSSKPPIPHTNHLTFSDPLSLVRLHLSAPALIPSLRRSVYGSPG